MTVREYDEAIDHFLRQLLDASAAKARNDGYLAGTQYAVLRESLVELLAYVGERDEDE